MFHAKLRTLALTTARVRGFQCKIMYPGINICQGTRFSVQNHVPSKRLAGYVILASKPRGLLERLGKYPLSGPLEDLAWGTCFLQPVVGIVLRVCAFDIVFSRRPKKGPEKCPAEGG